MPRAKVCNKQEKTSGSKKSKSTIFSTLKSLLLSCTGKSSVRVRPQHISVQPGGNSTNRNQLSTPPSVFCSSRPQTTSNESCSQCPSTCQQHNTIQVSTQTVGNASNNHIDSAESVSGLNATSGHTISTRPEFIGHGMDTPKSMLEGLSPSPVTSATITGDHIEERRAPGYYRTNLTQIRKMQRQRRMEKRMKREQQFGRKVSSRDNILVEDVKPKKRLSEQICEEEAAIKEMQQMLVDLDQDETEVFKKMQQLNNWKVKIESIKDYSQHMRKAARLNDVILILEERFHMLKNAGEKIEAKIGYKKENVAKLQDKLEELKAAGMTEEDLETKELLKQFLPTLGLPSDTVFATNLDDDDEDTTVYPNCDMPPRCKNPVATQLMRRKSRRTEGVGKEFMPPLPDILNEYLHTLERDLASMKSSENDGMKKFMQSQMQNGSQN